MSQRKVSLLKRFTHWFTYHPWLKLIAFVLAVLVWLYARSEIGVIY